jgi:hypothetical protein
MERMKMNMEIYDFVYDLSRRIKNADDREDVAQETLTILCEQGTINDPLTPKFKNYIKGIVWNYSTTLFNDFHNPVSNMTISASDLPAYNATVTPTGDREDYKRVMSMIRDYVFRNYYKKGRKLTKWRVLYLILNGYSYKEVVARLGIKYKTVVEYNTKAVEEINNKIGDRIRSEYNFMFKTNYKNSTIEDVVDEWGIISTEASRIEIESDDFVSHTHPIKLNYGHSDYNLPK